jgi:hypothetical protein
MPDIEYFAASIIAEVFASRVRKTALGVLGQHLPACDLQALVDGLLAHHGKPFRLALLGGSPKTPKMPKGCDVTTSATTTNAWRNDAKTRDGMKTFAVVLGVVREGRLLSLDGRGSGVFIPVGDKDLRSAIKDRAISLLVSKKRTAFWTFAAENDAFSVDALLAFAAGSVAAAESNAHDVLEYEVRYMWLLGLIPNKRMFENEGPCEIWKLWRPNSDMVARLRSLNRVDMRSIAGKAEDAALDDHVRDTARAMLAFARDGKRKEHLAKMEFDWVVDVLTPKKACRKTPEEGNGGRREVKEHMLGDEAAIENLIRHGGEHLEDIAKTFDAEKDEDDGVEEVVMDGRTVVRKARMGTSVVSNAVKRLFDENRFGGLVRAESAIDYFECLKMLDGGEAQIRELTPLNADDRYAVASIIDRVVGLYEGSLKVDVRKAWTDYVTARLAVLPFKDDLVDHPLLALCAKPDLLASAERLVAAYGAMTDAVRYLRDTFRAKHIESTKWLTSRMVALDVVFLHYGSSAVAFAGPTHPFHLWRWIQIARLLKDNQEEFAKIGDEAIQRYAANPPVSSPHLLLNSFVQDIPLPRDHVFIGVGSIGSLPLYGDPESRTVAKFRADEIADIAQRFVNMAPHAAFGFEVVAVDPPSVAEVLAAMLLVNKGRQRNELIPIHVRVFRTRPAPSSTDEEDQEMEELAGLIRESEGSLEIEPQNLSLDQVRHRLAARPVHYAMIFEPGDAQSFRVGVTVSPSLSPLVVPRHYTYDQLEDQFDVIIHGDPTPFGSYYGIFRELMNLPEGNTIGRRSGASKWVPDIARVGERTIWFSLIDQGIEPTLQIPDSIRLDKRTSGGRDIHTFTAHGDTITRYVEKVIRTGGLVPDPATEQRTTRLMRSLGGNTIPMVVSNASRKGEIMLTQARGLLGVLAVASWVERDSPDALLISLDSEASRRWILGATDDDARRGDLLCLRQSKLGLMLEVIEVKARTDAQGVVNVGQPGKDGVALSGHAVDQIDATISILKRIVPKEVSGSVDKARREILRDQMYMAVANRDLKPDRRARAVAMLDQFFETGPETYTGRLFIVHIESHQPAVHPTGPRDIGKSPSGSRVEVYEILESEADPAYELPVPPVPSPPPVAGDPSSVPVAQAISATSPAPTTGTLPDGIRILIGNDPMGNEVAWDSAANPNFGIMVTGDSGHGKSQTIRAVIAETRKAGYPVLIFDFKKDYVDDWAKGDLFANDNCLEVYDVVNRGLPFNPFELIPNEAGIVHPVRQAHELAAIIQRVEKNIGDKQVDALKEAICRAYQKVGIDPKEKAQIATISTKPPTFTDVIQELRDANDSYADSIRIRLQKFEDLGLFPGNDMGVSFERLVNSGTVLLMNDTANEQMMQALAEILVVKLHALLKRGDQPKKLRRMLVLDEAWRVAKSQRLVELSREGRAFGVGMLIGTQNPKDMPDNLVSCLRTQVYLSNKDVENQKVIVRQLCNSTTNADAQQRLQVVANLKQFQGYLIDERHPQGIRVNVLPYFKRKEGGTPTAVHPPGGVPPK